MALQNFVDKVGPIVSAAWLNAVDKIKFTIFGDAITKAQARTALMLDAPLEIVNGGTGARTAQEAKENLGLGFPLTDEEAAAGIITVNEEYLPLNVLRYGAVNTGSSADAVANYNAFTVLFAYLQKYGGVGVVPEGIYYLGGYINLNGADGSQANTNYTNIEIYGYGALIRTMPDVSMAFRIEDNFTPRVISIVGFTFDQENNSTAYHAIKLLRASCVHIRDCTFMSKNTRASFASIDMAPSTPGNDDTHGFWNRVDNCVFRAINAEGANPSTWSECAIRLKGAANSTQITGCSFTAYTYGIELRTDGVNTSLANSVLIDKCAFEGITTAVRTLALPAPAYNSTGLRVLGCRFELVGIGLSMECTDALVAPNNHAFPPHLENNWADGSPITWVYNPHNLYYTSLNPSHYGAFSDQRETIGGSKTFITGWTQNRNVVIKNQGETSEYHSGHLVLGDQHLWYSTVQGVWMTKTGAPASDVDGVVLGSGGGGTPSVNGSDTGILQFDFPAGIPVLVNVSLRWTITGSMVTLQLGENMTLTSNGTRMLLTGMPEAIRPARLKRFYGIAVAGGVYKHVLFEYDYLQNWIYIYGELSGNYFANGVTNCGIPGAQSFTYSLA